MAGVQAGALAASPLPPRALTYFAARRGPLGDGRAEARGNRVT
jgi:hypothetical protein